MKNSKIIEAMQHIDEDLVEEAVMGEKVRSRKWIPWVTAIAACLCLGIISCVIQPWNRKQSGIDPEQEYTASEVIVTEEGVTIPPREVSLSADEMGVASMIGFFIYEGRVYVHYDTLYEDVDLIDKHLGTITGSIDEWTPSHGYVEGAGSVHGEIYSVEGYDPTFMLCMKDQYLATQLFICDNGITLKKGSDLFEDRLQLSDGYINMQYETQQSWYIDMGNRYELSAENALIKKLITQLNEAPFLYCDHIDFFDKQEYHLYFNMKNGIPIHLRLSEDGYVCFDGMMDVCVQLSEELHKEIRSVFGKLEGTNVQHNSPCGVGVTMEECKADPELGSYIPKYIPEEMLIELALLSYDLDIETGSKTGTRMIDISYQNKENPSIWLFVQIARDASYEITGYSGPVVDASQMSMETIEQYMEYGETPEESRLNLGVWYGDVQVLIGAYGMEAEEILSIFQSIN